MIVIKHTKGIISKTNEKKVPKKHFGRHSNGATSEWFYFESQAEKDKFYADNFPPQPQEEVKEPNPFIEALKNLSTEEKELAKQILSQTP